MSASYLTGRPWESHGRNLRCIPARYYQPTAVEEIQDIVRAARRHGTG